MSNYLDKINSPKDLRKLKLNTKQKEELAQEIREFIINSVSKTGGHLASSLGVVELTIALHDSLNTPKDKIVWDVGHQTYCHKILTGRKNKFNTLRKLNGLAGFPKISESEYDTFDTGHSSTSISAALGMARARDLKRENYKVVAVIGDGALTGGMALEALNDVGVSKKDIIVILNDNQMSIEKNTGGLARALTKLRIRKSYSDSNKVVKKLVLKIPRFGKWLIKKIRRIKLRIKLFILPNSMFEQIGFKYLGPVDGNNIEQLESVISQAKDLPGPILIHCKTVKGKGYKFAEENPDKYHSTGAFDIDTGKALKEKKPDYSYQFGKSLVEIGKKNKNVVAITAAMTGGTGLTPFKEKYPDRFFDVEIAEQHAITMAAGMAASGLVPVVSIYSSFLQRAYDQIVHDVAMQKLHVVICVDRAGIVGADGETHQGMLDMSFLRNVPNLTIMAPKNFEELDRMLDFAINKVRGPVAIRYPRGSEDNINFYKLLDNNNNGNNKDLKKKTFNKKKIIYGRAEVLAEGNDLTIIAIGKMVSKAVEVADKLKKEYSINARVINSRFLKPFDKYALINDSNKKIYTIEDGSIVGGLYSAICEMNESLKLEKTIKGFAYSDRFIKHGSVEEIEKLNHMDVNSIFNEIAKDLELKKENDKENKKSKVNNNKKNGKIIKLV